MKARSFFFSRREKGEKENHVTKEFSPSELRRQPRMAKLVHLLKRTPREIPTTCATPAPHDVARWGRGGEGRVPLSLADTRMCSFRWTTDLRSHPQAQPDGLWRTLARCAPSAAEPLPEQLHLREQHQGALSHRSAMGRPMWRPQAGRLRTMGDRQ